MCASISIDVRSVVFDCPDPPVLARFYADLLDGRIEVSDPRWSEVRTNDSTIKLAFQRVDPYVPPQWPDGSPQQLHLDLTVTDLDAACARAASLGAVALGGRVDEPGCSYVVHLDPAGHPFCLCRER
jgi:predicted enzyme related to lactoylglutathione lyase